MNRDHALPNTRCSKLSASSNAPKHPPHCADAELRDALGATCKPFGVRRSLAKQALQNTLSAAQHTLNTSSTAPEDSPHCPQAPRRDAELRDAHAHALRGVHLRRPAVPHARAAVRPREAPGHAARGLLPHASSPAATRRVSRFLPPVSAESRAEDCSCCRTVEHGGMKRCYQAVTLDLLSCVGLQNKIS